MPRKRFSPEQIIAHLREAEVLLAKGQTAGEVCRHLGVSEQTYYRWRKEYGGLEVDQAKRLKALERENARLKKVVADQTEPPRDCRRLHFLRGWGHGTINQILPRSS